MRGAVRRDYAVNSSVKETRLRENSRRKLEDTRLKGGGGGGKNGGGKGGALDSGYVPAKMEA